MEDKRKKLRKLTGITILFIVIFMVIALMRSGAEEEMALVAEPVEYYWNENWLAGGLNDTDMELFANGSTDPANMQEQTLGAVAEADFREISLPFAGEDSAFDLLVFRNTLPEEYAGAALTFSSTASGVCAFLDGEMIYEYRADDGSGTKTHDNIVYLPYGFEEGDFWIILTAPEPDMPEVLGSMKVGLHQTVYIGVVGNSVADIGCCLLIVIAAIIMFVLALIRRYTSQPSRGELFLGLAGLAAGLYCFIGTDTLSIFYNIQEAYAMQEYLVLLLPLFLALYFERILHTLYPRRFSVLLWCVSIHAAVQIMLHTAGIRNLEDMINFSAAVIGIVCVTAIVSLLEYDYRTKRYQTLLTVLSMIILLAGGIANVIMNTVFEEEHVNTAGQYSMTVFSIMMAVMHILQLSKEYRASAEEKAAAAEQQNQQLLRAKQDADAARREAQAASEAKGKFLAHMSHEIRTPINAVLGMDEMILRESKEQHIKGYAMDIYTAGQTLLSLINDILDFSKIESGKMEIVPVEYDTSSLIHDLATMASQRAENKNIRLQVEADRGIPSRLYGDDVRIRQVLTNILTNAVKYTHEGTVWLRVHSHSVQGTAVLRFEVEDTGIGIREEDLPRLFSEFERLEEDRNRNIEGSGLGMNITVRLLSLLGSRLQVESVYGKGSKFYFELEQKIIDDMPIGDFESRVHQIAEDYHYHTKLYAPDAKILVVDDNAVNRKVLRNLLKETQIQVMEAGGGVECLELVKNNHYDLIFLDHMMPEMDGVETLHHIRGLSDFPCQDTPIVVLTANAVSGAKEKYLAEGFDDFLSKPVVPEKLEHMIIRMLPDELQMEAVGEEAELSAAQTGTTGTMDRAVDCPDELPSVDGLDWQYAWLHLPDMELLQYTVKEFYGQIDSAAEKLEQAYRQIEKPEQLEQYRIQVHAMKSLAATIGIIPLSGVAKILEYAAKDGRIDVITSVTAPFLEEWRSYHEKLKAVFDIGAVSTKEVTDVPVVQALVEMVRFRMQEMDIDQADELIGQLQAYAYPEEIELNMRKLAEAVTNLDPEEADRLADLLIGQINDKVVKAAK